MVTRAAALLLLVPAAAAADAGRLSFSALVGGGYVSDVFVGAGLGPDGLVQVTPSARLDLSFSPEVKAAAVASLSYGDYPSSGYSSLAESGGVEVRWLRGPAELSLSVAADHTSYSQGSPLDPSLLTSPTISDTRGARLSPLLRLQALGLEWRVGGVAGFASSTLPAGGSVPETDLAGLAGVLYRPARRLSLSLTYKYLDDQSPRPDFSLRANALFLGAVLALFEETTVEAVLQVQAARYATPASEELARIAVSVVQPLCERVSLELAYSFEANRSNDPSLPSATRHLAFLGLRGQLGEIRW